MPSLYGTQYPPEHNAIRKPDAIRKHFQTILISLTIELLNPTHIGFLVDFGLQPPNPNICKKLIIIWVPHHTVIQSKAHETKSTQNLLFKN